MILGITGHRPSSPSMGGYTIPNPTYEKVYAALKEKFELLKPNKIISGMALGTDQWAVSVALELEIPFVAAVPCDGQDRMWPDDSKAKYKEYLDLAEEVVIVSPGPYAPEKMHFRDKWIVDNSDCLLGVWSGIRKGGTFATIRYAEKSINRGRDYDIYLINPDLL